MDFRLHPIKREIEIEGFHSIYYFEFGKNFTHPPQKNDFWEIMYVDSGKINAIADGIGEIVEQGQLVFNKPMEVHAHISNGVDPNNMLVISFTCKSPAMDFFNKKIFTLSKTEKTLLSLFMKEADRALGGIPGDYSNKNPLDFSKAHDGSLQLLECYLTELLLILLRGGEETSTTAKRSEDSRELAQSSLFELMTAYLSDNVYGTLTLNDICSKFFMGKSQVCKIFSEQIGKSPIEYYTDLKTGEAKRLLRKDTPVSRVADMLGYSSIHIFSRAFKKNVGVSPTEYKKRIN